MDTVAVASVVVSGLVGLSGLVVGLAGPAAQRRHEQTTRLRDERRAAYTGLIDAYFRFRDAMVRVNLEAKGDEHKDLPDAITGAATAALFEVTARAAALHLCAPDMIRLRCDLLLARLPEENSDATNDAYQALLAAMRSDLGFK